MSVEEQKEGVEILPCHCCKGETRHRLRDEASKKGKYERHDDPDGYPSGDWWVTWSVYQCQGCEEFTLLRASDFDESEGASAEYFPPRHTEPKPGPPAAPDWADGLPDEGALLGEIYDALGRGNNRLAAMGLRAVFDELMNEKVGDTGTFTAKLDAMVAGGHLSTAQKLVIEPTLELGHASIHRGHKVTKWQVGAALAVVESVLNLLYIQPRQAARLRAEVPARGKTGKPSPPATPPAAPPSPAAE